MDTEITQAIIALRQAEQNFNYAAPEFVDIEIINLLAARMKVNNLTSYTNKIINFQVLSRFIRIIYTQ
jgi:hypothetical protein